MPFPFKIKPLSWIKGGACLIAAIFLLSVSPLAAQAPEAGKTASVLILFGPSKTPHPTRSDAPSERAVMLANMLGHFKTSIAFVPLKDYRSGLLMQYDHTFYIGERQDQKAPETFLQDIVAHPEKSVIWLRWNIDQLLAVPGANMGFRMKPPVGGFETLNYQGRDYVRPDSEEIPIIETDNWEDVRLEGILKRQNGFAPFSIQIRNFWYFSDDIFFDISNIVFCDLLHEVLDQPHKHDQRFYIRLEDIHPLRDPGRLTDNCRTLYRNKIPFMMGIISQYRKPGSDKPILLKDKPHLVQAIDRCAAMGGSIVMHGYTHQHADETGEGREFWNTESDRPFEDMTENDVRDRLRKGIQELTALGLYPIAWETPHYSASEAVYRIIGEYFSTAVESRQVSDRTYQMTQNLPYIARDIYGTTIIPESAGYINFEEGQTVGKKIVNLEPYKAVRDAVVGVFYHTYFEARFLERLIGQLKATGFEPLDLRDYPNFTGKEDVAIFSGLSGDIAFRPSKNMERLQEDGREIRVRLPAEEWLHTFLLNYDYQRHGERWYRSESFSEALVTVPIRRQSLFVIELGVPKPTWLEQLWREIVRFIIGRTRTPLETFQRWLIWFFFAMTFFFFALTGKILWERLKDSHRREE